MQNQLNLVRPQERSKPRCIQDIENGLKKGYDNLLPKSVSSFRQSQISLMDKLQLELPKMTFGEEIIIQKDTGTGKTLLFIIFAKLASKNSQVVIVVPTIPLGNQTLDSFEKYFPELKVNFIYTSKDNKTNASKGLTKDSKIIVIVQDSLAKLKDIEYIDHTHLDPGLIIIDESHLQQSTEIRQAIHSYKDKSVIMSLTATPFQTRIDKKNPDDIAVSVGDSVHWLPRQKVPYGRLVFEDNPDELIANKEILPIRWHTIISKELEFDNVQESEETGDFNEASLNQTLETSWQSLVGQVNSDIINNEIYEDRHNFFFSCPNNTQLADYAGAELNKSSGYDTAIVTSKRCGIYSKGKFIAKTQEQVLKHKWESGKKYVFQIRQLREGYNDDSIDCIVMMNFTKSVADYIQTIGRGRRVHPGQDDLLVVDIIPNRSSVANPVSAPLVLGLLGARENDLLFTEKQKSLNNPAETDFSINQDFVMSQMYESFEYIFQATERLRKDSLRNYSNILNTHDVIETAMEILEQKISGGSQLHKLVSLPQGYPTDLAGLKEMEFSELKLIRFNPTITYLELPDRLINRYQLIYADKTDSQSQVNAVLSINASILGDISSDQIKQKIQELLDQKPELYQRLINPKDKLFKSIVATIQNKTRVEAISTNKTRLHSKPALDSRQTANNTPSKPKTDKTEKTDLRSISSIFKSYLEDEKLKKVVTKICEFFPDKSIPSDIITSNFALFINSIRLTNKNHFEDWLQELLQESDTKLESFASEYINKINDIPLDVLMITLKTENAIKQKNNNEFRNIIFDQLKMGSIYQQLLEQYRKVERFNIGIIFTEEMAQDNILKYMSALSTSGISQFFYELSSKNKDQITNRFLHYLMVKIVPAQIKSINVHRLSENSIYKITNPELLSEIRNNGLYCTNAYLDPLVMIANPDVYNIILKSNLDTETAINKIKQWIKYRTKKDVYEDYDSFLKDIKALLNSDPGTLDEDYIPVNIVNDKIINLDLHDKVINSFPANYPDRTEEYYDLFIKLYKKVKDTDRNKKSIFEKILQKTRFIISLHSFMSQHFYDQTPISDAKILQPHLKGLDYQKWIELSDLEKNARVVDMARGGYFKDSGVSPMLKSALLLAKKDQVDSVNQEIVGNTPFISVSSLETANSRINSISPVKNQDLVNKEYSQLISNKQRNNEMIQEEISELSGYEDLPAELTTALINIILDSKGPRSKLFSKSSSYFGIVYSDSLYKELFLKIKMFVLKGDANFVSEVGVKELFKGHQLPESYSKIVGTKKYYSFSGTSDYVKNLALAKKDNTEKVESVPIYTAKQAITHVSNKLRMKELSAFSQIVKILGNKKTYTKLEIDNLISNTLH